VIFNFAKHFLNLDSRNKGGSIKPNWMRKSKRLQVLEQRKREIATDQLDPDGFLVIPGLLNPTGVVLDELHDIIVKRGRSIFNDLSRSPGSKRLQTPSLNTQRISSELDTFITSMKTTANSRYPYLRFCDPVGLLSKPGCGEQPVHADYDVNDLRNLTHHQCPRGMLAALEDGTELVVYPGSHWLWGAQTDEKKSDITTRRRVLHLNTGDVVFFRGDLLHSGSSYSQTNLRMHAYLDSDMVPRIPDRTWLLGFKRPDIYDQLMSSVDDTIRDN
jgi:hypothetical protein